MKHIIRGKPNGLVLSCGFVPGGLVLVIQALGVQIPAYAHPIRLQRIQSNDFAEPVTHYLSKRVTPQQQMRHERFSKHEARHLGVRFIVKQAVQTMIDCFFLAATVLVTVYVQW